MDKKCPTSHVCRSVSSPRLPRAISSVDPTSDCVTFVVFPLSSVAAGELGVALLVALLRRRRGFVGPNVL